VIIYTLVGALEPWNFEGLSHHIGNVIIPTGPNSIIFQRGWPVVIYHIPNWMGSWTTLSFFDVLLLWKITIATDFMKIPRELPQIDHD